MFTSPVASIILIVMLVSGFVTTILVGSNGIPFATAATVDSVIINEVELNPSADDRLSNDGISEQIELYNPTSSSIDLTGWTVTSLGGASQVTILLGSTAGAVPFVIPAKGYRTVGQDAQWLDNDNETVVLYDQSHVFVSSAGPFNDTYNDGQSWQRYPNGSDTWSFQQNTLGITNGPEDFAVSAVPNGLVVSAGNSIISTITVTPLNGYAGSATLGISGLPVGVTATFIPNSINVGGQSTGTSSLQISTSANTPPDTSALSISATDGTITHTTSVGLTVLPSSTNYPITHMSDTTASGGRALNSATSIRVEYVSPSSQLVGKQIDEITLRLARIGFATGGLAYVGVFDSLGNPKVMFGVIDSPSVSTSYSDYTFALTQGDLYTIQPGDRIGIKYPDGTSTNFLSVMVDTDAADPFDGTNSYRQWFTNSWQSSTGEDMYMILRQTHAASSQTTTHMLDATASGGRALYSAMSIRAEYVSPTSQLVGDNIDQITMRLNRVGSPVGSPIAGIFDSSGNMKRQFDADDQSTIGTVYADYTFSVPHSDPYLIQAGDRIGIKYDGGSSSNYFNVMVDTDLADPFDGTNSYRQWFTTSWQSYTGEDMYMILKQTDPAPTFTVQMEDNTASGGRQLYSALSIRAEYVSPTSQLIGDQIDQITLRLARVGTPTGFATIGVFDSAGNLKKQFGLQSVQNIPTAYSDYTYQLGNNNSYAIQSGDRLGIKFAGGNSTNYVSVMVDTDANDPFDGTNSYRQWFTTSWQSLTGEDMYMVLKQTLAS